MPRVFKFVKGHSPAAHDPLRGFARGDTGGPLDRLDLDLVT
jgi:hypothetical protein